MLFKAAAGQDVFMQPVLEPSCCMQGEAEGQFLQDDGEEKQRENEDHTMAHVDTINLPLDSRGLAMWPRPEGPTTHRVNFSFCHTSSHYGDPGSDSDSDEHEKHAARYYQSSPVEQQSVKRILPDPNSDMNDEHAQTRTKRRPLKKIKSASSGLRQLTMGQPAKVMEEMKQRSEAARARLAACVDVPVATFAAIEPAITSLPQSTNNDQTPPPMSPSCGDRGTYAIFGNMQSRMRLVRTNLAHTACSHKLGSVAQTQIYAQCVREQDHTLEHVDISNLPRDSRGLAMWPRAEGLTTPRVNRSFCHTSVHDSAVMVRVHKSQHQSDSDSDDDSYSESESDFESGSSD